MSNANSAHKKKRFTPVRGKITKHRDHAEYLSATNERKAKREKKCWFEGKVSKASN